MHNLFTYLIWVLSIIGAICSNQDNRESNHRRASQNHSYLNTAQQSEQKLEERVDTNKNRQLKNDFGKFNVFLQPNQKYILTPALLFESQTSFKKQYQLEVVPKGSSEDQIKKLFKIHPALQKIKSYNLTLYDQLNITDCSLVQVFFSKEDIAYLICLRKQGQFQVFRIQYAQILHQFTFAVKQKWNQMNVISQTKIVFYNISCMQSYSYDRQLKSLTITEIKIKQKFFIQQCDTYIEDYPNASNFKGEVLYQVCYTNNNQISLTEQKVYFKKKQEDLFSQPQSQQVQIKKDFIVLFLLDKEYIKLLDYYQIPQRKNSTLNHLIGLDVINSLQKVIMICYNLYNISQNGYDHWRLKGQTQDDGFQRQYLLATSFISSYCSIYKIYTQKSQMVLINRMQLQSSPYPLLQTSLQIKVMLAVSTQATITFYHLDIIKQMFQFIQKVQVPKQQNFNCYQYSQLQNNIQSVSLTCASDEKDFSKISFVLIYNQDLQRYVPVGDVFVQDVFFHTYQLIYVLNREELQVLQANQQYVTFDHIPDKTQIRVYQSIIDKPRNASSCATIVVYPAQQGNVYVDKPLPLSQEIIYDIQDDIYLKNAFQGSNISFVKVQVIDEGGNLQENKKFLKQERIYFYDYSLLISIYIKEQCIRVIKYSDSQFYRILQIQKSRVDGPGNQSQQDQENDAQQFYYYTQICSKYEASYICQLAQINSPLNSLERKETHNDNMFISVQSSKFNRLLSIGYIQEQNTFIYLHEYLQAVQPQDQQNQYHLMFLNLHPNLQEELNQQYCFQLRDFLSLVFETLEQKMIAKQYFSVRSIQLQNDFFKIQSQVLGRKFQTFCLTSPLKKYFLQENLFIQGLKIKDFCHSVRIMGGYVNTRSYIQEDKLIIAQTQLHFKPTRRIRKISTFDVINNIHITKRRSCYMTSQVDINESPKDNKDGTHRGISDGFNKDDQDKPYQNNQDQIEEIGIYRQYIIIVNKTTISKYHMGVQSELVYTYTFNPDFSYNESGNSSTIKYVLFLQKYLIIQFDTFYQLYDIGAQLISLQIATNNFNFYSQREHEHVKQYIGNLNKIEYKNVIINDAFLIQGDNIIIYEKGHIVVAKYITNPTLLFGPFQPNHQIVQDNFLIRLTPVLDVLPGLNPIDSSYQPSQNITVKIVYSHYFLQKIAKNIKILTVPSVTSNYQVEIWTNVFRGPVLQYYLSDTFDGQIYIKQHLIQINKQENSEVQTNNSFIIVPFNNAFGSKCRIKFNNSHLSFFNSQNGQTHFIEVPQKIKNQFLLKYLQIPTNNPDNQLFGILSMNFIIFITKNSTNNIQLTPNPKYQILQIINHGINMLHNNQNPIYNNQFQSVSQNYKVTNSNQFKDQQSFCLVLWMGTQVENQTAGQVLVRNNLHIFHILNSQNEDSKIQVLKHDIIKINQEIIQVRSLDSFNIYEGQLLVLTYTQNLLIYKLSETQNQSILQMRQTVNLKDQIPRQYRSNHHRYIKFQVFPNLLTKFDMQQKSDYNLTILLFAQADNTFHIQFQMQNQWQLNNQTTYVFHLKNIYSGYQSFQLKNVVQIGLSGKKTVFSSKNETESNGFLPPFLYFLLQYEYQTMQESYLVYYGYNYNFSADNQVGYLKCGQKIAKTDSKFQRNQNSLHNEKSLHSYNSLDHSNVKNQIYQRSHKQNLFQLSENDPSYKHQPQDNNFFLYQVSQKGTVKVQQLKISYSHLKQNSKNLTQDYDFKIVNQKQFSINTSIFMILNYRKPPIVTYILLNARNFNLRVGIYIKFIFEKDQMALIGVIVGSIITTVFFVSLGFFLRKYQPKQGVSSTKRLQGEDSDLMTSILEGSKDSKQERIIQIIEQSEEEESSSNFKQSSQDQQGGQSPRFQHMPPNKFIKDKESSIFQSPFRTYYQQNNSQQQQSDIDQIPEIKLQTIGHQHRDTKEQQQILQYLLNKRSSFASSTSSL